MAIALLPFSLLLAPLHQLAHWFVGRGPAAAALPHHPPFTTTAQAVAGGARRPVRTATTNRPLRVVHVVEGPRGIGAGRMVISGRLADVCAELDRLAELEARG